MQKILLVDDEIDILNMLAEFIEVATDEVEITQISDSIDALIKITEEKFDLIITDHKMPKMLGTEFIHNVRTLSASKNKDTKIIVLSAYIPMVEELLNSTEGIILMDKPFDPKRLKEYL